MIRGEGKDLRNEQCAIWSTAAVACSSRARARKAKPASALISQEPVPVTSVPGVICEPARPERKRKREKRDRVLETGKGNREGVSIPGAFAFVNCVCEVLILRGPGNIRFSIAKSSHRGITFSRDIHSLAPSKFLERSSLTNSERTIEERRERERTSVRERERGREGSERSPQCYLDPNFTAELIQRGRLTRQIKTAINAKR